MLIQKKIYTLSKILILFCLVSMSTTFAVGIVNPGDNSTVVKNIINVTSSGDFFSTARSIFWYILDFVRLVLNWVALLAMLYVGFLWVTSMGSEEKTTDGKNRIILILLGIFIINIPEILYRIITGSEYTTVGFGQKIASVGQKISQSGTSTSISENSIKTCNYFFCPQNFFWSGTSTSVIQFLEMSMLVVAVVMFTWGWFMMFFWSGSEETSDTAKRRIGYGVIVLLITGFIEMIYRAIFFQVNLVGTASAINNVLITWAKFFLYFAGPIAIIYIIIGGYYYITSGGDEERTDRGKKILMYTAFATIMLLLGYTFLIEIVGLNIF